VSASRPHGLRALWSDLVAATRGVLGRRGLRAEGHPVAGFRCRLCDGGDGRWLFEHPAPDARGHRVAQCQECSLAVIHPLPAVEDIPDFYGDVYYGEENAKFGPVTEMFVFLFRLARLRAIRMMGVRRGTILDIGCARGLFLKTLERVGHTAFGTELSEDSARTARRLIGDDRIRVGPVEDVGFDEGQFDAITAWQVFEHLHDPAATLDECHRILRPGGALLFSVPNIESWQARWSREEWFHLDVPRHLFHFGPDTLTEMLGRHGFEVESISHYCLEQNPFGLMQSALHRMGHAHMGLYNLLRGPLDRIGQHALGRMARYAAYLAAFPFAALVSYAWSLAGSGATFTVLARRVDRSAD
jgi:SAM-dependent methyltransferase